jgi:hypothetical protein
VARSLPSEFGQDFLFAEDALLTNGILKSFSDLILHSQLCSTSERPSGWLESQGSTGYNEDRASKVQSGQRIDEVGRCMILAVAENIWQHYWCGGSSGKAS